MRYLSLFSGIGGFELGIEQAAQQLGLDAECVGYSEIEPHAITTYEEHFNHVNYGDTTTIDAGALPDFDLLAAGFPCQPFSIAGKQAGFGEARGTLFFDVARILATKRPRYFILENVKGLLSHDGGRTIRVIIRTLTELGYCVEWQVLNSKNHGVPQSRERIYIVGHYGGPPESPVFPFTGASDLNLREVTQGVSVSSGIYEPLLSPTLNPGAAKGGAELPKFIVGPRRLQEVTGGVADAHRIYRPILARTLKSLGGGLGALTGLYVDEDTTAQDETIQVRKLTPMECERIQGFPDEWTTGTDTQRYRQCGNAVTVNVVRDVALRLLASDSLDVAA